MRHLIPEIGSSIGFCVTLTLFIIFSYVVYGVVKKGRGGYVHDENLPLADD